jgi:hypothetical protein
MVKVIVKAEPARSSDGIVALPQETIWLFAFYIYAGYQHIFEICGLQITTLRID